jgi:hypothetical protein
MQLRDKPNNVCTVGWSAWTLMATLGEIEWVKGILNNAGIPHHWTSFSSTPILARDYGRDYLTGLDFPTEWETAVLILITTKG